MVKERVVGVAYAYITILHGKMYINPIHHVGTRPIEGSIIA